MYIYEKLYSTDHPKLKVSEVKKENRYKKVQKVLQNCQKKVIFPLTQNE